MKRLLIIVNLIIWCLIVLAATGYATEDFTTWTETDPNNDIAVTASKITLNAADPSGRVYKSITPRSALGFRWKVKFKATTSPLGKRIGLFGMSDDTDTDYSNWTSGFMFFWNGCVFGIENITDSTQVLSTAVDLATYYYLDLRRDQHNLRLNIYSDSGYSTLVDEITLAMTYDEYANTVTCMSTDQTANTNYLTQPWNNTTGWTLGGSGTYTAEQATFDTQETLHLTAGADSGTDYGQAYKDIGTFPDKFVVEWKEYYDDLPNFASGGQHLYFYFTATSRLLIKIAADAIGVYNGLDFVPDTSVSTSVDTWYEWKAYCDRTAEKAYIYRKSGTDWIFLNSFDIDMIHGGVVGWAKVQALNYDNNLVNTYQDYLNINSIDQSGDNYNIEIEDLLNLPITINRYSYPFTAITGDLEDNFDDNDITDWSTTGSGTKEATGGELHITTDGRVYQTMAGGSYPYVAGAKVKISSVTNGSAAHLLGIYSNSGYSAQCLARNDGGTYKWTLQWLNGTWQKVDTDIELDLDTWYYMQITQIGTNAPTAKDPILLIDGVPIARTGQDFFDSCDQIDIGQIDTTNYSSTGVEFYADDLHVANHYNFYGADIKIASNNDLIFVSSRKTTHAVSQNPYVYVLSSTDNGVTWAHKQTIDVSADIDSDEKVQTCKKGLINVGNNLYLFVHTENTVDRTGDLTRRVYVYKATVSGSTLSNFSIVDYATNYLAGRAFYLSCLDQNDPTIVIGVSYDYTTQDVDITTYDTGTDTFSIEEELAGKDDYANQFPNEVEMFYDPVTANKLHALVRWDDYTGTPSMFQTYTYCTDPDYTFATHWAAETNLQNDWSNGMGGSLDSVEFNEKRWFFCRGIDNPAAGADEDRTWFIGQIDPDDMTQLLNSWYMFPMPDWKLWEVGNGGIVASGDPNSNIFYIAANAGICGFWAIELSISGTINMTINGDDGTGQWSIDGGLTWYNEGIQSNIVPGDYTIEYSVVSGYTKPANENITLNEGDTVIVTGTYVKNPTSQMIMIMQ